VFARAFSLLSRMDERTGMAQHRRETLAGLRGVVVEVGAGSGANFRHYPLEVVRVVALEPEPYLRQKAEEAAALASVEVSVGPGLAHDLPLEDASVDAAVASLVLCSVDDPRAALAEMWRVVRPGGELRFYEHVRAVEAGRARWQERVDVVWPRVAGGCHTARDTTAVNEASGWRIEARRDFELGAARFNPVAPHVVGRAVRLADGPA
jgi:ubiquinone/menaquinone biosynthesis C-methylase UbiE